MCLECIFISLMLNIISLLPSTWLIHWFLGVGYWTFLTGFLSLCFFQKQFFEEILEVTLLGQWLEFKTSSSWFCPPRGLQGIFSPPPPHLPPQALLHNPFEQEFQNPAGITAWEIVFQTNLKIFLEMGQALTYLDSGQCFQLNIFSNDWPVFQKNMKLMRNEEKSTSLHHDLLIKSPSTISRLLMRGPHPF